MLVLGYQNIICYAKDYGDCTIGNRTLTIERDNAIYSKALERIIIPNQNYSCVNTAIVLNEDTAEEKYATDYPKKDLIGATYRFFSGLTAMHVSTDANGKPRLVYQEFVKSEPIILASTDNLTSYLNAFVALNRKRIIEAFIDYHNWRIDAINSPVSAGDCPTNLDDILREIMQLHNEVSPNAYHRMEVLCINKVIQKDLDNLIQGLDYYTVSVPIFDDEYTPPIRSYDLIRAEYLSDKARKQSEEALKANQKTKEKKPKQKRRKKNDTEPTVKSDQLNE